MGLKGIRFPGVELEDPDKVVICRYPGNKEARWEWSYENMMTNDRDGDSAVILYWQYRNMNREEERRMAFTYGLSEVSLTGVAGPGGMTQLALSAPGTVAPDTEFFLTAYVWGAKKGQTVTVTLPAGISLAAGQTRDKVIDEDGQRVQVYWKLKAGSAGQYEVEAASGGARTKPYKITVKATSIFG
jgi:hypothetical protein